jgi:hypothetical protein
MLRLYQKVERCVLHLRPPGGTPGGMNFQSNCVGCNVGPDYLNPKWGGFTSKDMSFRAKREIPYVMLNS